MHIRDRVKELRRVRASELTPHPNNWRTHPAAQQDALRGVLAEVGYADALVARELEDGRLQLVDGHLRAETTPDALVPVLVVDLDDAEAEKVLLTLDPLAAMATVDDAQLTKLLARAQTDSEAVQAMLDELASSAGDALDDLPEAPPPEAIIPELYQVVIECTDEEDQRQLYEEMRATGRKCRLMSL